MATTKTSESHVARVARVTTRSVTFECVGAAADGRKYIAKRPGIVGLIRALSDSSAPMNLSLWTIRVANGVVVDADIIINAGNDTV